MNVIHITHIITLLSNLLLGYFVISNNPKHKINWYFGMFAIGIATWNLSLLIMLTEAGSALLWGRLAFSFASVMALGLVLFARAFPYKDKRFDAVDLIAITIGASVAIISATDLMVKKAMPIDGQYITGEFTPVYILFPIYLFSFLIYACVKLIKKYKKAIGVPKMQLGYATLGFILFFTPFVFTQTILPAFGIFKYNSLGPVFTIPMVILVAYSIVKYQFMDIRLVIQRGFIYTILSGFVIASYLSAMQVLGYFFQHRNDSTMILSGISATLLGVLGAPFIEKYFRKKTNRFFFKDGYVFSEAIKRAGDILGKNINIKGMIEQATEVLEDIFKTEKARIILTPRNKEAKNRKYDMLKFYSDNIYKVFNSKKEAFVLSEIPYFANTKDVSRKKKKQLLEIQAYMQENNTEVIVPIIYENNILGIILMNQKLSGDSYTKQDLDFLKIFSRQASVALKKAELYEQVKEYSRELEKKVEERTEKVRNLQKDQERIIMEISHELQTPLSIMKLELNLMKGKVPDKELAKLERSIDGASKLVYDFMHLIHLEAQESSQIKSELFNLSDLISELVEYFEVLAQEKDISISSNIKEDIFVLGDARKLEEAITNILSNAIKYMPEKGSKHERSVLVALSKKGSKAQISIKDTGEGIHKEDLPHVFERFYRKKSASALKTRGIGLGLAIAKKIVEKHKGNIAVESKLHKGTVFTITLPLIKN